MRMTRGTTRSSWWPSRAWLLAWALAVPAEGGEVPLTVRDPAGGARAAEPVTSGVPLPKGAVFSASDLRLVDARGLEVPAQFKVLSRWDGPPEDEAKALKWVLVDFQADVPAGGESVYRLQFGPGVSRGAYGPALLRPDGPHYRIETGALSLPLRTDALRFLGGLAVRGVPAVPESPDNRIVVVEEGGMVYAAAPPTEAVVEENGPLKAVIRLSGPFQDPQGNPLGAPSASTRLRQPYPYVLYNLRLTAYKGKDYLKVLFILENNGASGAWPESKFAPAQTIRIEELRLDARPALAASGLRLHTPAGSHALGAGFVLTSRGSSSGVDTFPYRLLLGSFLAEQGSKHAGFLEVGDGSLNVAVGMKRFHQQHPKDVSFAGGRLSFALLPAGEGYPPGASAYAFDGGRHKGHELLYRFSAGPRDEAATRAAMRLLDDPLFAFAPSRWYAETKAWTLLAPEAVEAADPGQRQAILRYERLIDAFVDLSAAEPAGSRPASTIASYRGDSAQWHGWMHFGDILWSKSYSSLHYDWTYIMFLHMMRHGDPLFYRMAQEFLPHRRDVDQYWGDRTDTGGEHVWINHLSRYEADCHNDPAAATSYGCNPTPKPSHNWNGGLVLGYLLTGDEEAKRAALEHYKYAANNYSRLLAQKATGGLELRNQGWTIEGLVNLYRALGDPRHIQLALAIAKNNLLHWEQQLGGKGVWEGPEVGTPSMQNTMFMYVSQPLVELYYETLDPDLGRLLARMADFTVAKNLSQGDTDSRGWYRPLTSHYEYTQPNQPGGDTLRSFFFADLCAAAYDATGERRYLDYARRLFRDATYHYMYEGSAYIDPARRDPATWADDKFTGTWSKVKGWLGRAHQAYLSLEHRLAASPSPPDTAPPAPPTGLVAR